MQRIIKRIETKRACLYSEMQYARYKQFLKIKNSISPLRTWNTSLHAFSLITNVPLLFVPMLYIHFRLCEAIEICENFIKN